MQTSPNSSIESRKPVTVLQLATELGTLGLRPGMLAMVHCSLKALGWVLGGPAGVYQALAQASNCDGAATSDGGTVAAAAPGTLLMPTFDRNNSEPSNWKSPPVDEQYWPVIRAETPPYDPATTPSIAMGAMAEHFRTLPGTVRSNHPHVSWAGRGPLAEELLSDHPLAYALGEESPLGRVYAADGWVLSLGTRATTILHLAEHRCEWRGKSIERLGSAMLVDGVRQWVEYEMLTDQNADFEELRLDYMAAHASERGVTWQQGPCAAGAARLFAVRPLVDFAVGWLGEHRTH